MDNNSKIDINTLGKQGFIMLCNELQVNPDDVKKSIEKRNELSNKLQRWIYEKIEDLKFVGSNEETKNMVLAYLYLSALLYANNVDLNKFVSVSPQNH